jgi:hypothetical protein
LDESCEPRIPFSTQGAKDEDGTPINDGKPGKSFVSSLNELIDIINRPPEPDLLVRVNTLPLAEAVAVEEESELKAVARAETIQDGG